MGCPRVARLFAAASKERRPGRRLKRGEVRTGASQAQPEKRVDNLFELMLQAGTQKITKNGGDLLGSVIKKRRKKMRKHKHRKLLARTRHQRRKGK
jgi:hypothetical protein